MRTLGGMLGLALATALLAWMMKSAIEVERAQLVTVDWMSSLPRATLAAPIAGPAIYAGKLVAAEPRVTPSGAKTAAYWWWLQKHVAKNKWQTVCSGVRRRELELRDGAAHARVSTFDLDDIGLFGEGRQPERGAVDVVALGSGSRLELSSPKLPLGGPECDGYGRSYTERTIPQGSPAEVLACFDDGRLVPCAHDGLHSAVGIPSLAPHRAARAENVLARPRSFVAIASAILFALSMHALHVRASRLRTLQPSRGAS